MHNLSPVVSESVKDDSCGDGNEDSHDDDQVWNKEDWVDVIVSQIGDGNVRVVAKSCEKKGVSESVFVGKIVIFIIWSEVFDFCIS